jgi:hypothetical protein
MSPSYESLRAELDEIVERYRAQLRDDRSQGTLTREEAAKRILKLGFTAADAERWLGPKPRRPGKSATLLR